MLLKLQRPKVIIFDWDNTIVDTWPLIHFAMNETLQKFNMPQMSFDDVRRTIHKSMRDHFPEIFKDSWQEAGDFYLQSYRGCHLDSLKMIDGAREFLQYCKDMEIAMHVISNKRGPVLRMEAKQLQLDDFFDMIIGAGDCGNDKPHRDVVDFALINYSSIDKADILFIGDSVADLDCAKNSGCIPVFVGEISDLPSNYKDDISKNVIASCNTICEINFT